MLDMKRAIDAQGHCLLEMPTGTGKTVCLVSLITAYQAAHPEVGKLIYCTRTVPQMVKCMEEIKAVMDYREKVMIESGRSHSQILSLCLSSRRNMCIHDRVMEESDREGVDAQCRSMTAPWVRNKASATTELCDYYESYEKMLSVVEIPRGVFTLDDIKDYGREKGWCPYFMVRHLIHHANILVYNYQYLLDPKISNLVSNNLEADSIVVFDEAHNIDNVCIEALSVILDKRALEASSRGISRLSSKVADMKASDKEKLTTEYQNLVAGMAEAGVQLPPTIEIGGNPLPPNAILEEAVPGSIRRAEHFIAFLKKIVEFFKEAMKSKNVEKKSPLEFIDLMCTKTGLERKPLRFTYDRLNSLLRTLEITALDDFTSLTDVANFASLMSTYLKGFSIITEPEGSIVSGVKEPLLQLACVDASIAVKPVFEKYRSVVITSGTLSPLEMYPKLLDFHPVVRSSFEMSTFRSCLLPLIVTKGADQTPISTRFEVREDDPVLRNYGNLLLEIVSNVPDGICCFFTSYKYMETVINKWDEMRIIQKLAEHKLIFLETKDVIETTLALENFRKACDSGRGAVFLSIARGKVAEGIDFNMHYGRCVVSFGVPYQYTLSHTLQERLTYMRENYQIRDNDFLTFDAMRQAAQCIGRVIRSKTDYGIVILADSRYNKQDKRSKIPPWITQFLREENLSLSTDVARDQIRAFLRKMGQPIDQEALQSILVTEEQIAAKFNQNLLQNIQEVRNVSNSNPKAGIGDRYQQSMMMETDPR